MGSIFYGMVCSKNINVCVCRPINGVKGGVVNTAPIHVEFITLFMMLLVSPLD